MNAKVPTIIVNIINFMFDAFKKSIWIGFIKLKKARKDGSLVRTSD